MSTREDLSSLHKISGSYTAHRYASYTELSPAASGQTHVHIHAAYYFYFPHERAWEEGSFLQVL